MTHVRVKPAREGESLVHPLDGPLAAEGGKWRRDQFTFKRLRDGDVFEIDENGNSLKAPEPTKSDDAGADDASKAALPSPGKPRGLTAPTPGPSAADTPKE